MDAYREGATGNTVLEKIKAMKKSHRVPLMIDQQPRVSYDRSRGRRIGMALEGNEMEGDESGLEGGTNRDEREEVVFDQESFAGIVHQMIWKGDPAKRLVAFGKIMRERVRDAPRANFFDGKLYFDEIVEEQRRVVALMDGANQEEEWRAVWKDGHTG